jgi:hypothetical protein
MSSINVADEIAKGMQDALVENSPKVEGHFAGVAAQLANTANELDAAGSPLAARVDSLLGQMASVLGED